MFAWSKDIYVGDDCTKSMIAQNQYRIYRSEVELHLRVVRVLVLLLHKGLKHAQFLAFTLRVRPNSTSLISILTQLQQDRG
jgi:hypothetical protein